MADHPTAIRKHLAIIQATSHQKDSTVEYFRTGQDIAPVTMNTRSLQARSVLAILSLVPTAASTPSVSDKAPGFSLHATDGSTVDLSDLTRKSSVVLVVLRGYPGYQCPFCQRQVQDFTKNADAFTAAGVQVVFVYPGPREKLSDHAREFLQNQNFPETFLMLLDEDYSFTNAWGLRWNASKETAYPSTFLIDQQGYITYMKVARSHGGRTTAAEVLGLIPKKTPAP